MSPLRNFKLTIEYEGTAYCGWQRQRGHRSIQEMIEEAARAVTGRKTIVHGAGRTDAGVHALGQTAHMKLDTTIPPERLIHALNAHLPDDIAVRGCQEVSGKFHARYDATGKTYRYTVYNAPTRPVLGRSQVYFVRDGLDIRAMRQAARHLVGRHDFKAFAATRGGVESTVREITSLVVSRRRHTISFEVKGDGFLYKMVRLIVGTLLEVGRKKIRPADMAALLRSPHTQRAGPTVPGKGLCLLEVRYQ